MDEMVAADGQGIAITHDNDDPHLRSDHLEASGKGQGSPVGGVHGVEIHVDGHPPRAADAGDHSHFVFVQSQAVYGPDDGMHDNADATSSAPNIRKLFLVTEVIVYLLFLALHKITSPQWQPIPVWG
jgi:hypothetical protein